MDSHIKETIVAEALGRLLTPRSGQDLEIIREKNRRLWVDSIRDRCRIAIPASMVDETDENEVRAPALAMA